MTYGDEFGKKGVRIPPRGTTGEESGISGADGMLSIIG